MRTLLFLLLWLLVLAGQAADLPEGMPLEEIRKVLAANPYDREHLPLFASRVKDEKDEGYQAHYMAVCYLGFLLDGKTDPAASALESLKKKHPQSLYPEKLAPSRLMITCPDCRRFAQNLVLCPVCRGSNLCTNCRGGGKVKGLSEDRPCPACQGTGTCANCDRRGKVPAGVCKTCKNRRQVLHQERIMRYYKIMLLADDKEIRSKRGVHLYRDHRVRTEEP